MPPGSWLPTLLLLLATGVTGCAWPSPPLTTSFTHSYLSGPNVARSQVIRRSSVSARRVKAVRGRAAILKALSGGGCPYPTSTRVLRRFGNVVVAIPWCDTPDPHSIGAEDARERALEEQLDDQLEPVPAPAPAPGAASAPLPEPL